MEIVRLESISHAYQVDKTAYKSFFKRESTQKYVLKDVSLTLNQGDCVSLIGLNGAGKSTLIKIMTGLIRPTNGTAYLFGQDSFLYRKQNVHDIGVVFGQKTQLWWDLSLLESFEMLCRIYGNNPKNNQWLDYLIDLMEVRDFCSRPIRELSFGQRMRGEFIACFLHKPKIVFLDEPTVGLDIVSKRIIVHFLREINQTEGTTILLASHELDDVEKITRQMYLIDGQRLKYQGTISDFKEGRKLRKVIIPGFLAQDEAREFAVSIQQNASMTEMLIEEEKLDLLQEFVKDQKIRDYHITDPSLADILLLDKETSR
ncbi:ATP-binding cassette domain-containing protein [Streptococcus suis]|nr:ATP-binding cassette domain-containing protein [Streptococcus suis]